jgi:hypothetical protein
MWSHSLSQACRQLAEGGEWKFPSRLFPRKEEASLPGLLSLSQPKREVERETGFDLYTGEQVGAGKKSLAYALTYQADDRTLTDAEVAQVREKITRRLAQELGAVLRSG